MCAARMTGSYYRQTAWAAHGITASCFRVLLYLDKTSNSRCSPTWRFVVLLYPKSIDQLMEMSTNAKGPCWPGIKVLEGQAGMFPITCPLSRDQTRDAACTAQW